jgi:integrase
LRPLSVDAVEHLRARLLARDRTEDAAFVATMAYAGLSPAEALRLRWDHVSEDGIAVEPAHAGEESLAAPERKRRTVRLIEPLADDLEQWRRAGASSEHGPVFGGIRAGDWDRWLAKRYRPALEAVEERNLGPGFLYHTFASLLVADGVLPNEIAEQLGVTRPEVVACYGPLFQERAPGDHPGTAAESVRIARARAGQDAGRTPLSELRPRIRRRGDGQNGDDAPGIGWDSLPDSLPPDLGVVPLSAEEVETIRARMLADERLEEATFVSVMAYAGLSQVDARALRWRDIGDEELELDPPSAGHEDEGGRRRTVRLLEPLAEDLSEWHAASGSPERGFVFQAMRKRDWQEWIRTGYQPVAGVEDDRARPNHLRHTFASLLIDEGVALGEVARQMALSHQDVVSHYAPLFENPSGASAGDKVREARSAVMRRSRRRRLLPASRRRS